MGDGSNSDSAHMPKRIPCSRTARSRIGSPTPFKLERIPSDITLGAPREVMPGMDMSLLSSVNESQQAATNVRIGTAVMAKVLNTTSDLQMYMVNKLLGKSGIGQNINIVA